MKSRANSACRSSSMARPSAAAEASSCRRRTGHRTNSRADRCVLDRRAERGTRLGADGRFVDGRPTMSEDETPRPRLAGLVPGLASAQMTHGALVLDGVGRLAQREVEVGPEIGELPPRTRVGRVAERATRPLDPDGERLDGMIGTPERAPEVPHFDHVAGRSHPPVERRAPGELPHPLPQLPRPDERDAGAPEHVAGMRVKAVEVGPVVGVGVGDDHCVDRGGVATQLEVGECPWSGIDQHCARRRGHQVAAPRTSRARPAPVTSEDGESQGQIRTHAIRSR